MRRVRLLQRLPHCPYVCPYWCDEPSECPEGAWASAQGAAKCANCLMCQPNELARSSPYAGAGPGQFGEEAKAALRGATGPAGSKEVKAEEREDEEERQLSFILTAPEASANRADKKSLAAIAAPGLCFLNELGDVLAASSALVHFLHFAFLNGRYSVTPV